MSVITVIIPTYNRAKTLPDAIDSVLKQTYADLELIIADDCSTDNTAELVRAIPDPRVRYLCLDHNQGACAARNAGIDAARGEYIAFQDSDDLWVPNKLERQMAALAETKADVCFHKVRRHFPDSEKTEMFPTLDGSRFMTHREMCNAALITTQTIIGRRAVFEEIRFDPLVKKTQDYDWAIRASRDHSLYYLDEVLVEQYFQNDSISMKGYRVVVETREYFLKKYAKEFAENPDFEIFQLRTIIRCKTMLGEKTGEECARVYRLSHSKGDLARLVLSRVGLLRAAYRIAGYK